MSFRSTTLLFVSLASAQGPAMSLDPMAVHRSNKIRLWCQVHHHQLSGHAVTCILVCSDVELVCSLPNMTFPCSVPAKVPSNKQPKFPGRTPSTPFKTPMAAGSRSDILNRTYRPVAALPECESYMLACKLSSI